MSKDISTADTFAAYVHEGRSPVAVLVIHGFTSTPGSVFLWAGAFEAAGYDVSVPLLEGHSSRWEDMIGVPYTAWTGALEREYDRLARSHDHVVVAGISMGGALALHLGAVRRPDAVLLVNPAVDGLPWFAFLSGALAPFLKSTPAIGEDIARPGRRENSYDVTPTAAATELRRLQRAVRRQLPGVVAPITLFHSVQDHVVPPASLRSLLAGLTPAARTRLRRVELHESYHVATLDWDAELINEASVAAVAEATGVPADSGAQA